MIEEHSTVNINSLNTISSHSAHLRQDEQNFSDSDVDNEIRFSTAKSKIKRVAEIDSDTDKENDMKNTVSSPQKCDSHDSNDEKIFSNKKKSRLRKISNSDSESSPENQNTEARGNYDLTRTKNKNKKLHDKFKKLKTAKSLTKGDTNQSSAEETDGGDTDGSSSSAISSSKIKRKLMKKSSHSLSSICDPDTSDDETNADVKIGVQKSKPRSTKLISPKPVKISAKQAMENMQKIKSESNRMLREKEVSLPYHRPKALTLKDIMNRRKPALTPDGKSLPIKMNNEQLKQYVLMLEQRQKEMMELCKSDTDDEEQNCSEEQVTSKEYKDNEENINDKRPSNTSDANDTIYDDINMENSVTNNEEIVSNEQSVKEVIVDSELLRKEELVEINENDQNISKNVLEKSNQETSNICENPALVPCKDLIDSTVNTPEEDQPMEGIAFSENNEQLLNKDSKQESQLISLRFDSEKVEGTCLQEKKCSSNTKPTIFFQESVESKHDKVEDDNAQISVVTNNEFSDDDFTMEELEEIIENAEINKDTSKKSLPNFAATLEIKPMLTGTPGMIIDLDDSEENPQKKLTGVELLKERFKYFAKLKSLEDMEKDREKKFKPGIQHLKLKQELEEQIAEQRSLEWEKRLEAENQLKAEMNADEGEEFDGEDVEKIEAKLEENDVIDEEEESSNDEDVDDTDVYVVKDKPRKRNPLIDDEADVSEDECVNNDLDVACNKQDEDDNDDEPDNENYDGENDSENDDVDSSESEEEEQQAICRKGRILKAFEDSDDEDSKTNPGLANTSQLKDPEIRESQDDEIQLAQPRKTYSDDLFTSQECTQKSPNATVESKVVNTSLEELGSQTFSILKSDIDNISDRKDGHSEKLDVICETQPCSDENFEGIIGMCTGGFSQNLVTPQAESSQLSQSQEIGEDVAELCTGKFYDNPFVSQAVSCDENKIEDESMTESYLEKQTDEINIQEKIDTKHTKIDEGENKLLKSILEELDDPELYSPKPNKYFFNATKTQDKEKTENVESTQFKKKFVIESDDEMNEGVKVIDKKKKRKKRKMENRALQISDDEEDEYSESEQEAYDSDVEESNNQEVEYDSEENEIEVQAKIPKKKRVGTDFFEQEAELTSEDEWIGSGDEDEAGLDRMEREEGDDETFHQDKLQRELGEIHMREVLDQDKREVRLLQELLFEDGDLGDGHRQRKFRWKNADGEEELGTNADEYADTQEDEFESEEQWRKQRHEREMFLKKLQEQDDEDVNVSINRSAFIKAKLASKPVCSIASEKTHNSENNLTGGNSKLNESFEKKTVNSIPSPKKSFIILQQNYHNSLLTRGRGALARLAALATPLAGDGDDAPKVNASSSRGNFVFAAITPNETGSKVTKRKAESAPDTPKLLKKMKQESNKSKSSLLDHL